MTRPSTPDRTWATARGHEERRRHVSSRSTPDTSTMRNPCADSIYPARWGDNGRGGTLAYDDGLTNRQFVALDADAHTAGDVNIANMSSSDQTDEARPSQQGGPTLEILVEHDP